MAERKAKGKPPVAAHWKKDTLIQEYWIPTHEARRESALFARNKKFLRDQCKLPCWVCGAGKSKSTALEVHHVFEWALWNAMDHRRVTAILEVLDFYEDGYLAKGKDRAALVEALEAAKKSGPLKTPDDIRNLVVFCQEHHRSKGIGVHMISFPIWVGLAALKPNGKLTKADVVRAAAHLRRLDEATADILAWQQEP